MKQVENLVGGSFGLSFTTDKTEVNNATTTDGRSTQFSFDPQFGYFVIDNLAVGAGIGLDLSSFKPDGQSEKSTFSHVSIMPFARYYFGPGVFVHGSVGIGSAKSDNGTSERKFSTFNGNLGGGYAIFLNDNVAIEPMLLYEAVSTTDKTPNFEERKNKTGGIALRVGLQIYLD